MRIDPDNVCLENCMVIIFIDVEECKYKSPCILLLNHTECMSGRKKKLSIMLHRPKIFCCASKAFFCIWAGPSDVFFYVILIKNIDCFMEKGTLFSSACNLGVSE